MLSKCLMSFIHFTNRSLYLLVIYNLSENDQVRLDNTFLDLFETFFDY